jgi:hypothetical protein
MCRSMSLSAPFEILRTSLEQVAGDFGKAIRGPLKAA